MNWSNCDLVEVVPGKVGGVPPIKGSCVAADTVAEFAELGETPEGMAYNYDLRVGDVRRVLAHLASRQTVEKAARAGEGAGRGWAALTAATE